MNELHRLSALRALPAIDIHAHYGCWNLPQPQLQTAQAEMPGVLPLLLRNSAYANVAVSCVSHLGTLFPVGGADIRWNEEALHELSGVPRVKLLVTLDPRLPGSFHQAERLLASGQCLGLKLHPVVHGYTISACGEAVYAFAERLGVPIVTHTGEAGCMPEDFVPFADRHPTVTTVLSHLGCSPDGDGMHQCRAIDQNKADNLYTDTSSWHSMEMNLLERAVQAVGADRILFGTDSGCYFSPAQRARIDCALLHAEEKKKILFENALQLFPQLQPDYASGCTALLQF